MNRLERLLDRYAGLIRFLQGVLVGVVLTLLIQNELAACRAERQAREDIQRLRQLDRESRQPPGVTPTP